MRTLNYAAGCSGVGSTTDSKARATAAGFPLQARDEDIQVQTVNVLNFPDDMPAPNFGQEIAVTFMLDSGGEWCH